jgi:membrane-bound lytic murein transglycosylase D
MKSLAAVVVSGALSVSIITPAFAAQTPQGALKTAAPAMADSRTQAVVDRAEHLFQQGEEALGRNDADRSRRHFDGAVDAILGSGLELKRDAKLKAYYVDLVDRIHKYQTAGAGREQAYVPAASEIAELSDAELEALSPVSASLDGSYDFDFTVGSPVYQFINYFTAGRGRGTMESGLRRSGRYRHMAERIFKEEGVPIDLIWLAQVESVWKPAALSHAAAKGIWQFIPSTGRRFGLDQNQWLDQRSHPEESTRAAARYLKWLHNYFGQDWLLAMAAYNSGEGNVSKAIARSGYADFWEIHRLGYLPTETRNYVPAILAVIIVAHNQERYGLRVAPEQPLTFDVAHIPSQTDLEIVADLCDTSEDYLRELNPELKRGATPPWTYAIKIPAGRKTSFESAYAALPPDQRIKRSAPAPSDVVAVNAAGSGFGGGNASALYTVRRGDTLSSVATRHGISATELARVNKLGSADELKSGQTLRVPDSGQFKTHNAAKVSYRGKNDDDAKASKKKAAAAPAKKSNGRRGRS